MNGKDPRGDNTVKRGRPAPSSRPQGRPQGAGTRGALDERYEEMLDDRMRARMARDERIMSGRSDAINRGKYADLQAFESRGHRKVSPKVMRARRRAKLIRRLIPVCALALVAVIALCIYLTVMRPAAMYKGAVADFDVQNYRAAEKVFLELGDYKETETYLTYINAIYAYDRGEYESAAQSFESLGDFSDSELRAMNARDKADPADELERDYQAAQTMLASGDYEGARAAFLALGDYKDSAGRATQAEKDGIYAEAEAKLAAGDTAGARELFASLGEYKDAPARVAAIEGGIADAEMEKTYQSALEKVSFKDWQGANVLFLSLGDYKDSKTYTDYTYGMMTFSSRDYESAYGCFAACGEFLDAVEMANESKYQMAVSAYHSGDYERAMTLFAELGDYGDSAAQLASVTGEYRSARYTEALHAYYGGDLAGALAIFEELGDYGDSAQMAERIKSEM